MNLQYRDASPWDVLKKPAPRSTPNVALRTESGHVTQAAILLALRSMKNATPTKIAKELGDAPLQSVSSLLYSMWRLKQVDRKPVMHKSKMGFRATFEYWIKPKETTK